MSDINQIINIGPKSALILQSIGINSREQLQKIGPIEAYYRLKSSGAKTSLILLYALYAGLNNRHWTDIDAQEKSQLQIELEEFIAVQQMLEG